MTCKTFFALFIGLTMAVSVDAQKAPAKFTPIQVKTPPRPAGQKDVLQLVTPKLNTVRSWLS